MKDTKMLALLVEALKKDGITFLTCPTCSGDGQLYRQGLDGDMIPCERCADCDGTGQLKMEDM